MTRPLDVFLPLRRGVGDARGPFLAEPATWLPAPATGVDDANWRSLRWDPSGDGHRAPPRRLLPVLDAQLGLAPDTTGAWSLVLSGSYDPPRRRGSARWPTPCCCTA